MKRGVEEFQPTPEQVEAAGLMTEDAPHLMLPKSYLSPSQVSTYLRCSKQYEYRYIYKMRTPPGALAAQGTACHRGAEVTHHNIVDNNEPLPTEEVVSAYSDAYDKAAERITSWKAEGVDKGAAKDVGVQLVTLYNLNFAPNVKPMVDANGVRGIEEKVEVDVNGVPMLGFIDLIDENDQSGFSLEEAALVKDHGMVVPAELRTSVVDFKTKAKKATRGELDGSLQFTYYSYAKKIPRIRMDMFLRHKQPKIFQATSLRTEGDYQWLFAVVEGVARAISAGVFPPCDPTSWCCSAKWCGYWKDCRGKVL